MKQKIIFFFMITSLGLGCGVKKSPTPYYTLPHTDIASPSPSPKPGNS